MLARPSFQQVTFFIYAFCASLCVSFLLSLLLSNTLLAHEIRPAIVDIDLNQKSQPATFKMTLKVNLEALISQVSTEQNSNDSDNAEYYNSLRKMPADKLAKEYSGFEKHFLEKIQLYFNQKAYPLKLSHVEIPAVGDLDLARDSKIFIEGIIPKDSQTLRWQWSADFGNAALRINTIENPALYSSYLLKGQASEVVKIVPENSLTHKKSKKGGGWVSQWKTFKNYLQVGFVHIVPKGIDHILFVVGLFLLSASLRPLLIQITTFTLAHSVTLALGVYGVLQIPASIVEPLIAASIVYVAIENIYLNKLSRWRPVIVFFFGLLHGLGFASVLTEIGLSAGYFATGLVAFNIGVELGQLSVIAACFLLVGFWFKNKPWYRQRITIPASMLIAIIASYWFIERVGWI